MTDNVTVSKDVMERVHAELVRAILDTPDYIQKLVGQLLSEKDARSSSYNDPDYGKPLFERVLRQELRRMIERSLLSILRENYGEVIQESLREAVEGQQKLDGSLAQAFGNFLKDDYKLTANVSFDLKSEKEQ